MRIASPFPRLGLQELAHRERAAGYVLACAHETSSELHAEAIVKWRRQHRPATLRALPSPFTLFLALVLVVL